MNTVTEIRDSAPLKPAGEAPRTRVRKGFPFRIVLLALFLLSLPIVNPWVRGDGVGYYAIARALLISHALRFEPDWLRANPSFRHGRVDASGHVLASQYTRTGHLDNHFTVGPAILWWPFLCVAHAGVLLADRLGAHIVADGFSRPYVWAMALATAAYGFVGLLLAFDLARQYVDERWAFLATVGIWFASSLPVYMYFNPSWSHALSAFTVALFVWYWHRTRGARSLAQWCALAAAAGLMLNVYYPNVILLLVPGIEGVADYFGAARRAGNAPRA
jgi:Dolichyl-phosphate-mannose-protein mannosyltransferase